MLYEAFFRALNQSGLHYVVIGGIAVNLHGFARATGDLDIVIALTDTDISKFIAVVKTLGLIPRLPVNIDDFADAGKRKEWIEQKNMKVFSVYDPKDFMSHIDVMIDHVVDFETLFDNRVIMMHGDLAIPVASIPDLIRLKQHAARGRDLIDIKALQRIEEIKREQKGK